MVTETVDFILKTLGAVGALGATALSLGKFMRWMASDKRHEKNQVVRWEIESFQANIKALQDENARCWEDNKRLREEHAVECEEHEDQIATLEKRLEARIKQVHDLNNLLQYYVLEYGDRQRINERNQERIDERQVRQNEQDANDENGDPK